MADSLAGKAALVTGASRGIGLAIAEALVSRGVDVAITARDAAGVDAAAAALAARGPGRAVGVAADVRDYASLEAAVARSVSEFGGLDVVVANAGVGIFRPVQELSLEEWRTVIDTNLTGAFYTVRAALGALVARGGGYVMLVSSLAGANAFAGGAAYNASKFGLNGFAEALMQDVRHQGVRVSYLMPGSVATHFNGREPSPEDAWKIQPEDVGRVVVDLLEMPERTLPSRVEIRPSRPPRR
jgi:NAD(P)-dependent dehydrogenase (short-subunit alcohol dehydrogenase family)